MLRKGMVPALVLLVASVLGGCAAGNQITYVAKLPDAVRPADKSGTANFGPIFQQKVLSNSVYTKPKEVELMRRVLLGPNLVFESSRSSLEEPKTIGPANAHAPAPDLADALGEPVAIELSSALLKIISDKGSTVMAPAVTRRWSWEWWCTPSWCPKTTWVERLILMNQKPQASAQAGGQAQEIATGELPTAAMAVRRLGIWNKKIEVVAERSAAESEVVFRPRRSKDDSSLCAPITLQIPVVAFMGEILSLKDGRILARIDEQRSPRLNLNLTPPVSMQSWKPTRTTGYTELYNGRPYSGSYGYISGWTAEENFCESAITAYQGLMEEVSKQLDTQLPATVEEIIRLGLQPLY
jgi:hypothetical protein